MANPRAKKPKPLFSSWLEGAMLSQLLAGARDRVPEFAAELLRVIARRLRAGEPIPEEVRIFLADALEGSVKNPKHAGAALGLVAKRKRPRNVLLRDLKMTVRVNQLVQEGLPLKDSRTGTGALTRVAEEFGVSISTVERALKSPPLLTRRHYPRQNQ